MSGAAQRRAADGLEIAIDRAACAGTGACARRAPRTFALDADGRARVIDAGGDPPAEVVDAARRCPRFAIAVRRDGQSLA